MTEGEFVWYDYNAADVDKAIAFYTETVGWKSEAWSDSDHPYTMFTVGEQSVGGVMELPDQARQMGAPPHWLAYTSVASVDDSVAKATELGASVLAPAFDIPDVGRISVLADPQGAVFALFRASSQDGQNWEPIPTTTPGAFSWHELMTSDLEAAWTFYSELFGWDKVKSMDMGEMGEYRLFGFGTGEENALGGMMVQPADMPQSAWMCFITVDDLDAGIERVVNHGGQVVNGPIDVPGGRVAAFIDNQGGWFAFSENE